MLRPQVDVAYEYKVDLDMKRCAIFLLDPLLSFEDVCMHSKYRSHTQSHILYVLDII